MKYITKFSKLNAILALLESEDLVLGLNFFTQDKLLKMFDKVPPEEAANVALQVYSLVIVSVMSAQ